MLSTEQILSVRRMIRTFCWITLLHFASGLAVVGTNIVSLQQPHCTRSPAVTLEALAAECETLGIESFDVYGDFDSNVTSSYLRQFEQEVADEFGVQDAVFMPSGVMAQSIALLIHGKSKKKRFACHESSHLLLHEQEAFQHLLHMDPIVLGSSVTTTTDNGSFPSRQPLSFATVQEVLSQYDNSDIGTLILELPHRELGGKCTPWQDVLELQDYCHSHDIKFHCDGARIFEATAGYDNKSLKELAEPFDSVYISFYKGLGGLSGAMFMGSSEFCNEARVWLRRFGGNLYTLLPYAVSGWAGYRQHWVNPSMTFIEKQQKLARIVKQLSSIEKIRSCVSFDPSVPQVNMIHGYLHHSKQECMDALESVENECDICVLSRLREVDESDPAFLRGYQCKFELSIGDANGAIDDADFVRGWEAFATQLEQTKSR